MNNGSTILLEKIKKGSILEELKEYEDLSKLTKKQRKILDYVIRLNEKCRFPRNKDAKKDFDVGGDFPFVSLIDKRLIFDTTIPELVSVFEYGMRGKNLPEELKYATWDDIEDFKHSNRGSIKSWDKKIEYSRANKYSRYHIALISKKQVPVFRIAFSFLDYLKI